MPQVVEVQREKDQEDAGVHPLTEFLRAVACLEPLLENLDVLQRVLPVRGDQTSQLQPFSGCTECTGPQAVCVCVCAVVAWLSQTLCREAMTAAGPWLRAACHHCSRARCPPFNFRPTVFLPREQKERHRGAIWR